MDMLMLKIVTYGKKYWWVGFGLTAALLMARAC